MKPLLSRCLGCILALLAVLLIAGQSGSPLAATDSTGKLLWKENYRPYGERVAKASAATASNSLWFAGKPQDDQTGLSYMGARYYNPMLGRFMGVDPVGVQHDNIHSFNRYAYANNNPLKFVDSDGQYAELVIEAASIGIGVNSLIGNIKERNWGSAAVDVGGIVVDGIAALVPVAPGVAGLGIKASREAGEAAAKATTKHVVGATATKEGTTLFHYTDVAGAKGIAESGTIRADAKGRVFLTDQKLSPAEVKDRLFIGNSGEKGSHVVEIQPAAGAAIRRGKNENELIHQGSFRDGRQGSLTVKPNE